MRTIQKIENEMEARTLRNLTKHVILGLISIVKRNFRLVLGALVAVAGSALIGGSIWLWVVGLLVGRFVISLLFSIALAVVIYILIYALVIGGILWILIS